MVAGNRILTAGLTEPGRSDVTAPVTTARRDGGGWRLDGVKDMVPAGQIADALWFPPPPTKATSGCSSWMRMLPA